MPRKKTGKDKDPYLQLYEKLRTEIVSELKEQLEKKLENVKLDLSADIKEQLAAVKAPAPATAEPKPSGMNLGSIMSAIQNPNTDLSQIAAMIPQGPPANIETMSDKQIEFAKQQQFSQILTSIIPALFKQETQNPLLQEMMARSFMESQVMQANVNKAILQGVFKNFGINDKPLPQTELINPIVDQLGKKTTIGTPAPEGESNE